VGIFNWYYLSSPPQILRVPAVHLESWGLISYAERFTLYNAKFIIWLGWAYLTKKVPRAATMPIVTAVVCFLSTQNMGS
jgi:hypothetical protein